MLENNIIKLLELDKIILESEASFNNSKISRECDFVRTHILIII